MKDLMPIMKQVRIFEFPYSPHRVLPKSFENSRDRVLDCFLPYPVIAIEDVGSCVVLADSGPNQVGVEAPRLFIEYLPMVNNNDDAYREDHRLYDEKDADELKMKDVGLVNVGVIEKLILGKDSATFYGGGYLSRTLLGSKKEVIYDADVSRNFNQLREGLESIAGRKMTDEEFYRASQKYANGPKRNAYVSLQEVIFFNQPDRFILETTPVKVKAKVQKDKLLRSHQRPLYTILEPEKIREKLGITYPNSTGKKRKSPIPHEKKRYISWLRKKRFSKDKDGKPIEPKPIPWGKDKGILYYKKRIVSASWVGQSEAIVGNKRYRVVLNNRLPGE